MKFRTALLSTLLAFSLAACSLAEDVTPPPNYIAPTVALTNTIIPPTSTSLPPTATSEPAATETLRAITDTTVSTEATSGIVTPETGTTPDSGSSTPEPTGTPGVQVVSVSGHVLSGSGGELPADLIVTLRGFDMPVDETSNPTESINLPGTILPDGSYTFKNVESISGRIFLAEVVYNNVPYQSDYVIADQGSIELPDMTVNEASDDFSKLNLEQVQIALDYSSEGVVSVAEMYVLSNTSLFTVTVATDGTSIPFIQTPEEATNVTFQVASGSSTFIGTETGFALRPLPVDQKYGLVAYFDLPYEKKMTLKQPFLLAATVVTLYTPVGITVKSDALTDSGVQDFSGTSYQVYEAAHIPAGESLSMKITGTPEGSTGTTTSSSSSTQKWLIIGLGTGGMALIGVGLFLFMRNRKDKEEDEEDLEEEDAEEMVEGETVPEADRDAILDAIIALDEQYKSREISKGVYDKRRSELKEQLKHLG